MSNFQSLNLSATILAALTKKGYTTPTPIQAGAIPHLLAGKDFLGIAQTGTGKTAAFALPILDNLFKTQNKVHPNNVRALILTPTRELASQIVDNIKLYGQDLHLKSAVIFGGVNISNQIRAAKQGFDILVATPGRLLDLVNQKQLEFSQLEIFVLDEADRMLDMGFINDVRKIIAKLPKKRQTLFFSATMPKDVAVLADAILNDPIKIEITPPATTVEKIDQKINMVEKANKPLLLKHIIDSEDKSSSFLVFSKTKHGANRIVEFLDKQSVKVAAIHGNKSQAAREKALEGFRKGNLKVLVATDIAARGIDIPAITHVINYDIPNHPESYVHRIGRTARAGREGVAISFCDNSERNLLKAVEKTIGIKLPIDDNHPFYGIRASAGAKSALDKKDRPKSGYKTTPKPRATEGRAPVERSSYFSENRRWKSDGDNDRRPKPSFNGELRKPRGDFESRDSNRNFDNKRPRFSSENSGERSSYKPRFSSESSGERSSYKPKFSSETSGERSSYKPKFSNDRGSSRNSESKFGERGFGERSSYKPRFAEERGTYERSDRRSKFSSDDSSRPARSHFSDRKSGFGQRTPRENFRENAEPKFGERSARPAFKDHNSDFGKKDFSKKPSSGFGGKRFNNNNNGGNRTPSRPKNK